MSPWSARQLILLQSPRLHHRGRLLRKILADRAEILQRDEAGESAVVRPVVPLPVSSGLALPGSPLTTNLLHGTALILIGAAQGDIDTKAAKVIGPPPVDGNRIEWASRFRKGLPQRREERVVIAANKKRFGRG